MNIVNKFVWVLLVLVFVTTSSAIAEDSDDEKPFADVRVVLQLSDQARESVVLDVANNLIKNYGGPDAIDIEIITFGPGIRLLYAGSQHETRIASLVASGVRFYACKNTLDTMERTYGSRPVLSSRAQLVQAGVARIVDKVSDGYILVRP